MSVNKMSNDDVIIQIDNETNLAEIPIYRRGLDTDTDFLGGGSRQKKRNALYAKHLNDIKNLIFDMIAFDCLDTEDKLLDRMEFNPNYFYDIAIDKNVRGDIRSQAARLLTVKQHDLESKGLNKVHAWIQDLKQDTDNLVRMGVMYGYSEAGNDDGVREFLDDTNHRVKSIAEILLG